MFSSGALKASGVVLLLAQASAFAALSPSAPQLLNSPYCQSNCLGGRVPLGLSQHGSAARMLGLRDAANRKASFPTLRMSGGEGSATAVFVYVSCKSGTEDAFKAASLDNAKNSVQEEGIARFDCVQQQDDPTKFVLVEVYKNGDAPAAHKETAHYKTWRETVADMMAVDRKAVKYTNCFPASFEEWDVPAALAGGAAESGKDDLLAVHVFVTCKEGTADSFKAASLENAKNSVKEPGIARFDVVQNTEDKNKFCLIEVYRNGDAPAAHKETAHYKTWRETVEDMMAEPRSALKYSNCFPATDANWKMP